MLQRGIGPATVGVGSQGATDHGDAAEEGEGSPRIETATMHHEVVGGAGSPIRGGENHSVAELAQDVPADRHLGGVEVLRRDWDEDACHGLGGQPTEATAGTQPRWATGRLRNIVPGMADMQPPEEASTESMFTPDDAIESLWVKAYDGEVIGEVLFARMAERVDGPDRAHKMQVLSTMERRTREEMVTSMERAGLPTEPKPATVAEAEALADALADVSWSDFMASFEPITTQYAAMYARIGELDPAERATADLLVAHEMALREFGRLELAGAGAGTESGQSLAAIEALPHLQ
jgi:hypothetical protein